MPYKILHLLTATFLYECLDSKNLPVMSFEVDNIENNEDFTQADFKTRIQAKKFLHVWFTTVKTHRNLYKKRPELYSCCLDERFYSIIKVKD